MSTRFVNIDRETPLLFPVDLREWLPENHSAHFIADAAEMLDIQTFKINRSGSGGEQHPPSMTAALLIYCCITRRMPPRVIEEAAYTDAAARYICGNRAHPDHSVLCRFRTKNKAAFQEAFTKILVTAQEMEHLKKAGGDKRRRNENTRERGQTRGGKLQTGNGNDSGA